MHFWQVTEDQKTRYHQHTLSEGFGHSLLAPVVAHVFEALRVGATLWDGRHWWALHSEPTLGDFEAEHRVDTERIDYNERHFVQVQRKKKTLRGELGGYSDLFVPIVAREKVVAVLVAGPFATARPTSADLLERWRWLTGRQAHPADPEFAAYLSQTLATLVLDGNRLVTFEKLLALLARLLAGVGDAGALMTEAEVLQVELERIRFPERVWEAVRTMVDDRFPHAWQNAGRAYTMLNLGLSRVADHVLVGLTVSAKPGSDLVDEALRREALQRASVELGRGVGDVIAGQVGDHGVVFLSAAKGGAERKRQKLVDLSERVSQLARRRFGLSLHFGASVAAGSAPLSRSYQAALGAAESALAQGTRMVIADPRASRPAYSLSQLRAELCAEVEQRPDLLRPRFDRYLEVVAAQCGYRTDSARGHLEAGFERIAEPLLDSGTLDKKSFGAMCEVLSRASSEASTITDLFAAYRRAVLDVSEAVQRPVQARQDRSLRSAVDYIRQHYTERLALKTVARVAGFTPSHFSKLFIKREHMPFEQYLRALRLERAQQLLADTD
ncbi:MAG TPA: AraC family transcriptional regulator, partial [Polyangiaceae bacterium]|nr:AraC family transcriptional regulator [Polyangiaceae bacterium]